MASRVQQPPAEMAGLLTLWTLVGLAISGETRCPSPAAVRAELGQLRQGRAPDASDGARISLARRGGRLRVVLLGPDGSELMARELPAGGRCRALARSTALLIEVWSGQGRTAVPQEEGVVALQDGWLVKFRAANAGQFRTGSPLGPPTGSVTDTASEGRRFTFINHTAQNKTDAPMVHVLFEILPADLKGPSIMPVKKP